MTKRKDPKDYKKFGRPTKYTPELAQEICDAIASSEKGLRQLCEENPHWPERANIFIWLRKHPEFRLLYTEARENQVEVSVDYMQDMWNEPHHYIDDNGNKRVDVPMLRVKMDAIKWQAGKLKPRKYGPDIIQESTNNELKEDSERKMKELDIKNKKEF